MIKGYVHSLETFGSADGPGVRFIVFLKGCKMRCKFCHNPDTWNMEGAQIYSPDELLQKALRYKSYWGENGGITVSGGEPLLQMEFVTELFELAKKQNINTAVDTAGQPFSRKGNFIKKFDRLAEVTDLFLLDIKQMDGDKHKNLTGHRNENILDMARYLSEKNKDVWIRHVLVPGVTDEEEELKKLSDFVKTLSNVKKVQILPYHTLGKYKWENLGLSYPLGNTPPPTKESVEKAENILKGED